VRPGPKHWSVHALAVVSADEKVEDSEKGNADLKNRLFPCEAKLSRLNALFFPTYTYNPCSILCP